MTQQASDRSYSRNDGREAGDTIELRLLASEVDLSRFDLLLSRLCALGVTFTPLAEEQRSRPEWLSWFCDLDNSTRGADAQVPRTAEQLRDRLASLEFTPESCILGKLGDQYAGYTYLDPTHSMHGVLLQGWTGVRPEYRRQGLATALKAHGILLARRLGIRKSPRRRGFEMRRASR